MNLLEIQKSQLAAESIARNVARDFANNSSAESAQSLADEIASSFSVSPNQLDLATACEPADCSEANAQVHVLVKIGNAKAMAVMPMIQDSGLYETAD